MSQTTDPIADLLTRIRNALAARLPAVKMPHSRMKSELARLLKQEGFIRDFEMTEEEGGHRQLGIKLKYVAGRESVIHGLRRMSRPGLRRYAAAAAVPRVRGGMGVVIVSTSRGMLTDREARRNNLGGELVCSVW